MHIQINPHSLLNLEHICEVLYKLHPSILNDLVEMEGSLGGILGFIDYNNLTLEEREFLANIGKEVDYSKEPEKPKEPKDLLKTIEELKEHENSVRFHELRKIYSTRY